MFKIFAVKLVKKIIKDKINIVVNNLNLTYLVPKLI